MPTRCLSWTLNYVRVSFKLESGAATYFNKLYVDRLQEDPVHTMAPDLFIPFVYFRKETGIAVDVCDVYLAEVYI